MAADPEVPDATLVARVVGGDPAAFRDLFERYFEVCRRLSLRLLGNRHDAEDALQETFLRAYQGLGRYRERDAFRAWLFSILVNQCRTTARQRARRDKRFVLDGAALERAPGRGERSGDLADALQSSLATLTPPLREAFLLRYGEGLDYAEMSRITGTGVSALKMRVKRAHDQLRPRLEVDFHG
jgi:RNA polymerase sigma-70 factor (ECF subfamily)